MVHSITTLLRRQRCLLLELRSLPLELHCFSGNDDFDGVVDPQFPRCMSGRCIDLRLFIGTISQGHISSAIGQTLESPFVSELGIEHAGCSSADLVFASLSPPPSSDEPAVTLA